MMTGEGKYANILMQIYIIQKETFLLDKYFPQFVEYNILQIL